MRPPLLFFVMLVSLLPLLATCRQRQPEQNGQQKRLGKQRPNDNYTSYYKDTSDNQAEIRVLKKKKVKKEKVEKAKIEKQPKEATKLVRSPKSTKPPRSSKSTKPPKSSSKSTKPPKSSKSTKPPKSSKKGKKSKKKGKKNYNDDDDDDDDDKNKNGGNVTSTTNDNDTKEGSDATNENPSTTDNPSTNDDNRKGDDAENSNAPVETSGGVMEVDSLVLEWKTEQSGVMDDKNQNNDIDLIQGGWHITNDGLTVRFVVQDSEDCGGVNPYVQEGSARTTFTLSEPINVHADISGLGEMEDTGFENMSLYINNELIVSATSPGLYLGCGAGPLKITDKVPMPITLEAGVQTTIEVTFTTQDTLYHKGSYYEMNMELTRTN